MRLLGRSVAPFTGAWIEIYVVQDNSRFPRLSHPSRVRGLKFRRAMYNGPDDGVAPFTGAWIEIFLRSSWYAPPFIVAPFTGAWIEIV